MMLRIAAEILSMFKTKRLFNLCVSQDRDQQVVCSLCGEQLFLPKFKVGKLIRLDAKGHSHEGHKHLYKMMLLERKDEKEIEEFNDALEKNYTVFKNARKLRGEQLD